MPKLDRRTLSASTIIAAGLAGTVADNDGTVGLVLFAAAAAAALYLVARPLARLGHQRRAMSSPVRAKGRSITATVVTAGVLLAASNVFKSSDDAEVSRALNHIAFYGAVLLGLALTVVLIGTVARGLRNEGTPSPESSHP